MFSLSQFPLQFEETSLTPYMSAETLQCHHGKHLATYIKNLNDLMQGTVYETLPLDEIIVKSASDENAKKIFNNAAQVFNHNFFFRCLAKDDGKEIPEEIITVFGSKDKFFSEFKSAAAGVFGSGWAWLVKDSDSIKIMTTANADTPIAHGIKPLLALDVWEHAYYLDYQNRRVDFIDAFLQHMVNWEFVKENLQK